jgi:hypothetical protein
VLATIEYDAGGQLTWKCVYNLCSFIRQGSSQLLTYPSLIEKIGQEQLNQLLTVENTRPELKAYENTSAAYWLCHTPEGRQILQMYPALVKKISPTALNALRTAAAGRDKNFSALYGLCMSEDGLLVLLNSPDLIKKIRPETLKAPVRWRTHILHEQINKNMVVKNRV